MPIPAIDIALDLYFELRKRGCSTTVQSIDCDGAFRMLAVSRSGRDTIRIHAVPFKPRASGAERALRGIRMLSLPDGDIDGETIHPYEHRVLIATFCTSEGRRGPGNWIHEFFQRIPNTEPKRSPIWRRLAQAARVGTPLRCSYPLTSFVSPTAYVSHHIGALIWPGTVRT